MPWRGPESIQSTEKPWTVKQNGSILPASKSEPGSKSSYWVSVFENPLPTTSRVGRGVVRPLPSRPMSLRTWTTVRTGVVERVTPGSPADVAGVLPGDGLLAVNGLAPRDVIDVRLDASTAQVVLDLERHRSRLTTTAFLTRAHGPGRTNSA